MIKAESGNEGKEPCPGLGFKKDKGKRIRDKRGRIGFGETTVIRFVIRCR
jgi:hypothetical protein